jgi:hypothetical protein
MPTIGRFVIWVEDDFGHIAKATTWFGVASEGIAKVKAEMRAKGLHRADVWATPIANH